MRRNKKKENLVKAHLAKSADFYQLLELMATFLLVTAYHCSGCSKKSGHCLLAMLKAISVTAYTCYNRFSQSFNLLPDIQPLLQIAITYSVHSVRDSFITSSCHNRFIQCFNLLPKIRSVLQHATMDSVSTSTCCHSSVGTSSC